MGREAVAVEHAAGAGFGGVVLRKIKIMKKLLFKMLFAVVLVAGTTAVASAQTTRAFYDKKGHVRFTIAYYGEKELPREVRAIVKPEYYDYTILTVQEVKTNGKSIYLIDMEDSTTIKTVRVADGEMELIRTLTRGDRNDQGQTKATASN